MTTWNDHRRSRNWIVVCLQCKRILGLDFADPNIGDLALDMTYREDVDEWDKERKHRLKQCIRRHSQRENHKPMWLDDKAGKGNPILKFKINK